MVLVLDRSGSMNDDAGDTSTKVQKLREAANAFISIMQPGDGIGLVRFNETAQRLMEVQDVGAAPGGAGRMAVRKRHRPRRRYIHRRRSGQWEADAG